MDDAVGALGKGSRVWYRHDAETWLLAELREDSSSAGDAASGLSLQLLSGSSAGSLLSGVEPGRLVPANPELQAGIPDLTQLSYLNEPSILDNLARRYGGDSIYTNAGPVLIAVNPCRALPLYTADTARTYKGEQRARGGSSGSSRMCAPAACMRSRSAPTRSLAHAAACAPPCCATPVLLPRRAAPCRAPTPPQQPARLRRSTSCRRTSTSSRAARSGTWCAPAPASRLSSTARAAGARRRRPKRRCNFSRRSRAAPAWRTRCWRCVRCCLAGWLAGWLTGGAGWLAGAVAGRQQVVSGWRAATAAVTAVVWFALVVLAHAWQQLAAPVHCGVLPAAQPAAVFPAGLPCAPAAGGRCAAALDWH